MPRRFSYCVPLVHGFPCFPKRFSDILHEIYGGKGARMCPTDCMSPVEEIRQHLIEKGKYNDAYIGRVVSYMEKEPDLAQEFASSIPKNAFPDTYITVRGTTAKYLGARTLLSRSAIYVALARMREEGRGRDPVVEEELVHLREGKK